MFNLYTQVRRNVEAEICERGFVGGRTGGTRRTLPCAEQLSAFGRKLFISSTDYR